jgi:hypothetical protein
MRMPEPARFLNLDVILKSNSDLDALARRLEQDERVIVLSHYESAGQFVLVFELSFGGPEPSPRSLTQQLLTIIGQFSDAILELWKGCTSLTFDYGFEGGNDNPALETTIPADLLTQIGRIGADVGITVYPYRTH